MLAPVATAQANPLLGDFAAALRAGPGREWMRGLVPHEGPQAAFFESTADIVIYGGTAGPGKTWALLVEPLRHAAVRGFGCVIFRRELTRITNEGGMWDEATKLYLPLGATKRQSPRMEFKIGPSAKVQFGQLEHEDTKHAWSGAQICMLGFDQGEEFTEGQFWFLQGRNRSACGVRPYIRMTANPVPPEDPVGGWLAKLIQWWWDPETGYALPERSGVVRWFVRIDEQIRWAKTRQDAVAVALAHDLPRDEAEAMPLSLTFIAGKVQDNPSIDRAYVAKLHALPLVDRERLLRGNWKIRPQAGLVFNRAWFPIVEAVPADAVRLRGWDKAASPGRGDHSSGLGLAWADGIFYVYDLVRGQWSYGDRNKVMDQVASGDTTAVPVWMEQEPGSGGKESAEASIRQLAGYDVHAERSTGSKLDRARPVAAQAEVGNVRLVKAEWNEGFLQRVHNFTGAEGGKDDDVDALSLAFNKLAAMVSMRAPSLARATPRADRPTIDERMRARADRRAEMTERARGRR